MFGTFDSVFSTILRRIPANPPEFSRRISEDSIGTINDVDHRNDLDEVLHINSSIPISASFDVIAIESLQKTVLLLPKAASGKQYIAPLNQSTNQKFDYYLLTLDGNTTVDIDYFQNSNSIRSKWTTIFRPYTILPINATKSLDITTRITTSKPVFLFLTTKNQCFNEQSLTKDDVDDIAQTTCSSISLQIPPIATLGQNFMITERDSTVFHLVSPYNETEITVNGNRVGTSNIGDNFQLNLNLIPIDTMVMQRRAFNLSSSPASVQCSKPCLLLSTRKLRDRATVSFISAVKHFSNRYWITMNNMHLIRDITFVVPKNETDGLRLGRSKISLSNWITVNSTLYATTRLSIRIDLPFRNTEIYHINPDVRFSLLVRFRSVIIDFDYTTRLNLMPAKIYCVKDNPLPGDKFDNDCDGKIDEEIFNGKDDDQDGEIDEDVQSVPIIELSPTVTVNSCANITQSLQSITSKPIVVTPPYCPLFTHDQYNNVSITYVDSEPRLDGCRYRLRRTWSLVDHCSNEIRKTQIIEILPPNYNIAWPANIDSNSCPYSNDNDNERPLVQFLNANCRESAMKLVTTTYNNTIDSSCNPSITRNWNVRLRLFCNITETYNQTINLRPATGGYLFRS